MIFQGYEYQLHGYGDSWQSAKMTDHVVVDGLGLAAPHLYNVSVRAVNTGGLISGVKGTVAKVDTVGPQLTGKLCSLLCAVYSSYCFNVVRLVAGC